MFDIIYKPTSQALHWLATKQRYRQNTSEETLEHINFLLPFEISTISFYNFVIMPYLIKNGVVSRHITVYLILKYLLTKTKVFKDTNFDLFWVFLVNAIVFYLECLFVCKRQPII